MTIEWKAFWSALGAAISLALAALTIAGVLSTFLAITIAVALALVVWALSRAIIDACEMWRSADEWAQRRVWVGTTAAAAAYAAWLITAVLVPTTWQALTAMAATLGLLAVSIYWTARAIEWRIRSIDPPKTRDDAEDDSLLGVKEKVLRSALRRAGLGYVRVLPGAEPLRSDAGWQFRVRTRSKASLDKGERAGAQVELTQRHMEALAIALAEITGRTVESDWVRVRKEPAAGTYSITVTNRDLMAEVIPYVDDPTPTSITEPALVGVEIDGRERRQRLDVHQRTTGGSTGGKSSLINVKLAHTTRSTDAVTWIGGVQKLYDLVGPWLEPYHGTGLRPPIDWVANGQTDTLAMMAAAMAVARWRQRQPMGKRKWRKIFLELDEFSFVAQSKQQIKFQGEWVTASQLASMLLRGAASGDVHVDFASQRSTVDHFGDRGGDVIANIAVNFSFRSKDFAEVGRTTGDYHLPIPRHQGEYYLTSEGDPVHLKSPYIQTTDPSKPRLHDGATIEDVSWARRHLVGPGLSEAEGLAAAGAAYAARHQVVDDRMMTYLTQQGDNEDNETDEERADSGGEVFDAITAQLTALAHEHGLDLSTNDPAPDPPVEQRRPDAILAILKHSASPEGMNAAEVAAILADNGDQATTEVVAATLSRMYNKGQIHRPKSGRYTTLDKRV